MRIPVSDPGHLLAAGRIDALREIMGSNTVPPKVRRQVHLQHGLELGELLRAMQPSVDRAGHAPQRNTEPELVVERTLDGGRQAWIAWAVLETTTEHDALLQFDSPNVVLPEYRPLLEIEAVTAQGAGARFLVEDPLVRFLANVERVVGEASADVGQFVGTDRTDTKARWERFVAVADVARAQAGEHRLAALSVAVLMEDRLTLSPLERLDLASRWDLSPNLAQRDMAGVFAAIVSDWQAAAEEADTHPRRRLQAAARRADHVSTRLSRLVDHAIRDVGRSQELDVVSHRKLWPLG